MARFTLKPVPPFRLDLTAWVLRRLPINEIDRWDGRAWRRVMTVAGSPVELSLTQEGTSSAPRLIAATTGGRITPRRAADVGGTVTKMLGLDLDLSSFYAIARADRRLAALSEPARGLKSPRFASVFEALVNGIACQQISLVAGLTLLNRLAAAFGRASDGAHAFPEPADLADARASELTALGFSGRKAEYILSAARGAAGGGLDLEALAGLDDEAATEALLELRGVGRWTAEYVALRGLGRLDVFPADDVGGQSRLKDWLGLKALPGRDGVLGILERWRPYRGLIYFHLLSDFQRRRGFLAGPTTQPPQRP